MSELVEVQKPTHRVKVMVGYTKNMGNFESLRIDLGLDLDGKPGDSPNVTFEKAYQWASDKLVEKVNELNEELNS